MRKNNQTAYFLEKGCKIAAVSEVFGVWGLRPQTPEFLLPLTDIDSPKVRF